MKVTHNGISYDLSDDERYRIFCSVLGRAIRSGVTGQSRFNLVKAEIEDAEIIGSRELTIYRRIVGKLPVLHDINFFHGQYRTSDHSGRYTFLDGEFYELPTSENLEDLVLYLVAKLLYEAKRHDFNHRPCTTLRKLIAKLEPEYAGSTKNDFEELLKEEEESAEEYYNSYYSDNSDGEQEKAYQSSPPRLKAKLKKVAEGDRKKAEASRYSTSVKKAAEGKFNKKYEPPKPKFGKRQAYGEPQNLGRVEQDLAVLNGAVASGKVLEVLPTLGTQFCVAQYRGVHYSTSFWSKTQREFHRQFNEIGLPQFSLSVIKAAGFTDFVAYLKAVKTDPETLSRVTELANNLKAKLLTLRETSVYVGEDDIVYPSQAHWLQRLYTSDYEKFHRYVKKHYQGLLKDYLLNEHNPFISMGDTAYHALKYAYGNKFYGDEKHRRLRPCWDADGKPAFPYSGKVYAAFLNIKDFFDDGPFHIPTLFNDGTIVTDNETVPERENCFPAFLAVNKLVKQHVAKFPSFERGVAYPESYLSRYGLTANDYKFYQESFKKYSPHTKGRRFVKCLLGEHLSAFHEARLTREVQVLAKQQGKVLVFRNNEGGFSLKPVTTTPENTKEAWKPVMNVRKQRQEISAVLGSGKEVSLFLPDCTARLLEKKPVLVRALAAGLFPRASRHEAVMLELKVVQPVVP